jgi:hypothetical protein
MMFTKRLPDLELERRFHKGVVVLRYAGHD